MPLRVAGGLPMSNRTASTSCAGSASGSRPPSPPSGIASGASSTRGSGVTRDAFAEHGSLVLYNSPDELVDEERRPLLPPHRFLGSTLRAERVDPGVEAWIREAGPFVYVSFGSFLSVRDDVLRRVVDAAKALGVRLAVATGSAAAAELGDLPPDWLVRPYLPQVRLLRAAAAAVTHGGNNSVTEALGSRRSASRAAILHRPVRRGRLDRTERIRGRPRPQRRVGRRARRRHRRRARPRRARSRTTT